MKKAIKIISILLIFNILFLGAATKDNSDKKIKNIKVDARSAIAVDANSKRVLYDKGSHNIMPMASTTKIITSLVAIKYGNLDEEFEISGNASSIRGSKVGYKKGEKIKLKELLYGLMYKSGNDAAIAIAEGISGSVDEFVKVMNEYAKEIGLMDSSFESPHGLDSNKHYSSAYDLAMATIKAHEEPFFNEITSTKSVDGNEKGFSRSYQNINKILWQIPGANGVKTGYTGNAGKCLVSSVNNGTSDIIIVVLNCPERWRETEKIYNYTKEKYEYRTPLMNEELPKDIKEKKLPFVKDSTVTYKININEEVSEENKLKGTARVYENQEEIFLIYIYSE